MNFSQQPQVQVPLAAPPQFGTSVLPIDGQLVSISLSAPHTVTGSNASGAVYRRIGVGGAWQQIPAPPGVVRISVADDGTTFATTNLEQICRFVNNAWQQVAGQAKTVAAGNAGAVFCANAAGQIWRFEPMSGQWQPVAAPFQAVDISVGKDGTLYAVDAVDGIHRFEPMTGAWSTIPGQLTQISVHDAACVVGVNRSGPRLPAQCCDQRLDAPGADQRRGARRCQRRRHLRRRRGPDDQVRLGRGADRANRAP
jgi:hypothetical protein